MSKATYTDQEFLIGLRQNNDLVLRALYKKFYTPVLKYVVNNSGNSELAEDIYQETIIVLYENVQKPEFQLNCQLQTFIYSIAKRLWLKHLRKHAHVVKWNENEEDDGYFDVSFEMAEHLKQEEQIRKMNESLENLGEPCRTLLKDFYVFKMNMDEISEKFGYTNSDNAKNQKYKCLQRLKRYFFEDYKEEE